MTHSLFVQTALMDTKWWWIFLTSNQARNQLGTPGVPKSFLRGAQIFQAMSNSFQRCPTDFCKGGGKVSQWAKPPCSPTVYGPASNSR